MPQQYDPNESVTLTFTGPAQLWNQFVAIWQKGPYEVVAPFIGQFVQQTNAPGPSEGAVPAPNGGEVAARRGRQRVADAPSPDA